MGMKLTALGLVMLAGACAEETPGRQSPGETHVRTVEGAAARAQQKCSRKTGPLTLRSERFPLKVHYANSQQQPMARRVLAAVERAWQVEVEELGFRPPPSDEGRCGGDDAFDVFIVKGTDESYVEAWADVTATRWDDQLAYMVFDPWGKYGMDHLETTLAHEFNHACQAADDWFESEFIMESTATLMEDVVTSDDNGYRDLLVDYQSRPDWSFDRPDSYKTWYMYAGSLYLMYLRDAFFGGDPSFLAEVWKRTRSDADSGEPDFEDALDGVLQERAGIDLQASVVGFARWRWYTGDRDDGRHFAEGGEFPKNASVAVAATVRPRAGRHAIDPAPMKWGAAYIDVVQRSGDPSRMTVSVASTSQVVRWVLQAVPGLTPDSDGEIIDLDHGRATVDLGPSGRRTLILVALPRSGRDDVDDRRGTRFPVSLVIE